MHDSIEFSDSFEILFSLLRKKYEQVNFYGVIDLIKYELSNMFSPPYLDLLFITDKLSFSSNKKIGVHIKFTDLGNKVKIVVSKLINIGIGSIEILLKNK